MRRALIAHAELAAAGSFAAKQTGETIFETGLDLPIRCRRHGGSCTRAARHRALRTALCFPILDEREACAEPPQLSHEPRPELRRKARSAQPLARSVNVPNHRCKCTTICSLRLSTFAHDPKTKNVEPITAIGRSRADPRPRPATQKRIVSGEYALSQLEAAAQSIGMSSQVNINQIGDARVRPRALALTRRRRAVRHRPLGAEPLRSAAG
jgi:hypothetical protein